MNTAFYILYLILPLVSASFDREKQIRQFVEDELKYYPEARLKDLYKNYFQDAYGPGHIIRDTTSAGEYLDWELLQPEWTDPLPWQALGTNHDFYRINLVLLKNGTIPRDTLLTGMVKSARMSRNPGIESWMKEWNEVLSVIREMKPDLPDIESDEEFIAQTLASGKVVMHHSEAYEKKYHPHYRIIHRTIFDLWQKKYLK
ncbi:MAG TPA: hypothetical protein VN249_12315 [Prolixibacteraceae bacterium]|nr:hypothetical protein [Prolixibacteraceae bacterium]